MKTVLPGKFSRPFMLGTGLFLAIVALAGCLGHQPVPPAEVSSAIPTSTEVTLPVPQNVSVSFDKAAEYVDEKACSGCHAEITRDHAQTAHANTLRKVSPAKDAAHFRLGSPVKDALMGAVFRPRVEGAEMVIEGRLGANRSTTRVTHALGSGSAGITYLDVNSEGNCLMPRIQLYRHQGKSFWDWTPGLQPGAPTSIPLGAVIPAEELSDCLGCHSTVLAISAARIDYGKSILNVGCQRCHGPAKEHLRQVSLKPQPESDPKNSLGMPRLGSLKAAQVAALCETCHRGLTPIPKDEVPTTLARLQGRALRMSACYLKGDAEQLSCLKCHGPHTRKETSAAKYEQTCKSCHSPSRPEAVACKVSPDKGCIGCHMGKEVLTVFGKSEYTNHWIRKKPTQIWRDDPRPVGM